MSLCIVKLCPNSSKKTKLEFSSSLHLFPKSTELIQQWLLATGQFDENLDQMVNRVIETRKTGRYRMCSLHFTPRDFYSTGLKMFLYKHAIPSIFGNNLQRKIQGLQKLSSSCEMNKTAENVDFSLNEGTEINIAPVVHTAAIFSVGVSHVVNCQSCGHQINKVSIDVSTNTEPIMEHKQTQCDQFNGTRTKSTQTKALYGKRHNFTSTTGLITKKDAYTWTMGDVKGTVQTTSVGTCTSLESTCNSEFVSYIGKMSHIYSSSDSDLSDSSNMDITVDIDTINETATSTQSTQNSFLNNPDYGPETCMLTAHQTSMEEKPSFEDIVKENKYIVFESCLDVLFKYLPCGYKDCTSPIICINKRTLESILIISGECLAGHQDTLWRSQPTIGQMPIGNLLYSASILLSGNHFEKIEEFSQFMGVKAISKQTYYKIQKKYLFPTIHKHWIDDRERNVNRMQDRAITLCGDGQCESPGYGTKNCTYTMIEEESQKIIDFNVVQVAEASSSVAMESKAFRRTLNNILNDALIVLQVATDRHNRIHKILTEEYPQIRHQFDIWHYGNSILKKLLAVSRKKNLQTIAPWIQGIINHLWTASLKCGGNEEIMKEIWQSLLYHICNVHCWMDGTVIKECGHKEISQEEQRKTPWLEPKSNAFEVLHNIICDPRMDKDFKSLAEFCHTGAIDVFHSLVLKYRPKLVNFKMDEIEARTKLAVLAHNYNAKKIQERIRRQTAKSGLFGELEYKAAFPKSKNEWQTRPIYKSLKMDHIYPMIADVLCLYSGDLDGT
ncbi:uncharacterized protein LOC128642041 isoform X1 [Bombina bombina]|uniref:uncharacterized protein LOC128642041 isoform X1 n=1 Tax=Bombina bombina TaxID=8345 RepID=UPI00235B1CDA|nr:uncharacterized protein LOC128642041 isoform X1 [Bombina bombina]